MTTKKPLRRLLEGRYPASITRPPKKGFGIPVSRWLRTVARESVERSLSELPADQAAVRRHWDGPSLGTPKQPDALWALHVFGLWENNSEAAI